MEEQEGQKVLVGFMGEQGSIREAWGHLGGASSVSGFMYGSHVPLYPDFGEKHHWATAKEDS